MKKIIIGLLIAIIAIFAIIFLIKALIKFFIPRNDNDNDNKNWRYHKGKCVIDKENGTLTKKECEDKIVEFDPRWPHSGPYYFSGENDHRVQKYHFSNPKKFVTRRGFDFTIMKHPESTIDMSQVYVGVDGGKNEVGIKVKERTEDYIVFSIPVESAIGMSTIKIAQAVNSPSVPKGNFTVYTIFNPYHKKDTVYMESESDLEEYIQREDGYVFQGSIDAYSAILFNYSQFSEICIESFIDLVENTNIIALQGGGYASYEEYGDEKLDPSDPVSVGRFFSVAVNQKILAGNWGDMSAMKWWTKYSYVDDEGYTRGGGDKEPETEDDEEDEDGNITKGKSSEEIYKILSEQNWRNNAKPPGYWNDVEDIITTYVENGKRSVSFGQCWVFGAVLNCVMRSLGIPSRETTNFDSGHPQCSDPPYNYICEKQANVQMGYNDLSGKKYVKNAENTEDNTSHGSYYVESIGGWSSWNFHVWNDVWMARPDLAEHGDKYNGWQALDATPQNQSRGLSRCGPAPLRAVKEKKGAEFDRDAETVAWDVGFVTSEVNFNKVMTGVVFNCDGGKHLSLCKRKGSEKKILETETEGGLPITSKKGVEALEYRVVENLDKVETRLYEDYKPDKAANALRAMNSMPTQQGVTVDLNNSDPAGNIEFTLRLVSNVKGTVRINISAYPMMYTGPRLGKNFNMLTHIVNVNSGSPTTVKLSYPTQKIRLGKSNTFMTMTSVSFPDGANVTDTNALAITPVDLKIETKKSIDEDDENTVVISYTNPYKNRTLTNVFLDVKSKWLGTNQKIGVKSLAPGESLISRTVAKVGLPVDAYRKKLYISAVAGCKQIHSESTLLQPIKLK